MAILKNNKEKKALNPHMAHLFKDWTPKGGYNTVDTVTPEQVEKAKVMCVRHFGGKQETFSGALFGYNNPAYMPDYETWCAIVWKFQLKLPQLYEGQSYKTELMKVLGVRAI